MTLRLNVQDKILVSLLYAYDVRTLMKKQNKKTYNK